MLLDKFPKFIIETHPGYGDCIILSKVKYHYELATNKDKVKGGGWWNFKDNTFTFYGESHDFKKASFEDIKKCVLGGKVYNNYKFSRPISHMHNFKYNTGIEIINIQILNEI